jgi:hypothetical protein
MLVALPESPLKKLLEEFLLEELHRMLIRVFG